jgi:hypothetical protein
MILYIYSDIDIFIPNHVFRSSIATIKLLKILLSYISYFPSL